MNISVHRYGVIECIYHFATFGKLLICHNKRIKIKISIFNVTNVLQEEVSRKE